MHRGPRIIAISLIAGAGALLPAAAASAATQNPTTGQPGTTAGVNCAVTALTEPGNAASSPGSPFNEPLNGSTGGVAGGKYAGNGAASVNNANSAAAVSQYDIACGQLSSH